MRQLKDIKTRIERRLIITGIELDSSAAAFYISDTPNLISEYEAIRIELRDLGFLVSLRENESRFTLRKVIRSLATTPGLREISKKVEDAREPGVRRAWIDRFFEDISCPDCGANLVLSGGQVNCTSCSWDPSPEEPIPNHVIVVTRRPGIGFTDPRINIVLFLLTLITTTITGSALWMGYSNEPRGDSFIELFTIASTTPGFVAHGLLFFSLPLLTIAGIHELGHYYVARRYGVNVSLPYFLPLVPILSFLGTMGAFISIREPIPDRKTLFDIGLAGPVAGFIVSIPIIFIGLFLTEPVNYVYQPGHGPSFDLGLPIFFKLISQFVGAEGSLHPLAFAGWIGLLLTAMNLLPAGQLDGGHIFRAILGDGSLFVSHTTIVALMIIGYIYYPGWFLIALIVLLIGVNHPPPLNDLAKLGTKRKVASIMAIAMLLLCIAPQPISVITYDFDLNVPEVEGGITPGGIANFSIHIENSGEVNNTYLIENRTVPDFWTVTFDRSNVTLEPNDDDDDDENDDDNNDNNDDQANGTAIITVIILAPLNATPRSDVEIQVAIRSENGTTSSFGSDYEKETITFQLHVREPFDLMIDVPDETIPISTNETLVNISVRNIGMFPIDVHIHSVIDGNATYGWNYTLSPSATHLFSQDKITINLSVSGSNLEEGSFVRIVIIALGSASQGDITAIGTITFQFHKESGDSGDGSE